MLFFLFTNVIVFVWTHVQSKDCLTTQQPGDSIGNYTETIQNSATSMSTSTESVITGDNGKILISLLN